MAGKKSPASKWCMFRDSQQVRSAVQYQIKKRGGTLVKLADDSGIGVELISNYLHSRKKGGISQYKLFTLCGFLGINVEFKLGFK